MPVGVYPRKLWLRKHLSKMTKRAWKDPKKRARMLKRDPRFGWDNVGSDLRRKEMSKRFKKLWKTEKHLRKMRRIMKRNSYPPSEIQLKLFYKLRTHEGFRLEHPVEKRRIDIAYPARKLAIEVDGPRWHGNRNSRRKRNRVLKRNGWKVIRFDSRKLHYKGYFRKTVERILELV